MKYLFIFVALFAASCANEQLWKKFKADYGKNYRNSIEELIRFKTFNDNKKFIDEHNALYEQGKVTFKKAINQFADLTHDEFLKVIGAKKIVLNDKKGISLFKPLENNAVPEEVDWRTNGVVTSVKSSIYPSITGVLGSTEALYAQTNSQLVDLSDRSIGDCVNSATEVFQYLIDNGVNSAADYPLLPEGQCNFQPDKVAIKLSGFQKIKPTENDLQEAVAQIPVSVGIDASSDLMFYTSGILVDTHCSKNNLNHIVLNVGYGEENGQSFWIIKNAWGAGWGEEGYVRMARNHDDMCGISTQAFIPVL